MSRSAPSWARLCGLVGRVPSSLADARPGTVQNGLVSDLEPGPSRTESVLLTSIYVVPLTLSIAFLAYVGLPGLALALLAVEATVSAMVVMAQQPEGARLTRLAAALVLLAVAAGAGAFALLV